MDYIAQLYCENACNNVVNLYQTFLHHRKLVILDDFNRCHYKNLVACVPSCIVS